MADLFKSLKPKANLSKNGFDLSRKHVFSSKAGQALPVLALETVPGDHHEIDLLSLTRTRTMNTAAFLRGKMRYDFFFVPYSQLWHPFNQFISQRDDKHSTQQKNHLYCPVVSLGDLLYHIYYEDSYGNKDIHGFGYADNMVRLLDLLGYGDFRWLFRIQETDLDDALAPYLDRYVNVFRLAAYQHIWYDYYRNKYYDVVDNSGISVVDPNLSPADYVYGFNFDDIECSTFANSILNGGNWSQAGQPDQNEMRLRMLLRMNYVQWKKDLFTSALPSMQFGSVSSVDINSRPVFVDSQGSLLNSRILSSNPNGQLSVSSSASNGSVPSNWFASAANFSLPSAFDVLSIRKAEALQAWKQNTLRAGNMTDDSFEAHFGVKPYYEGDENVRFLGSFAASININSVEATSSTGNHTNGSVGDLAATGVISVNGNKIKVDCKDYGIIMCISSFLPESEYSSNCLDKANTLYEPFDFFTPEFQNIGLEPVTLKENRLGGILSSNWNNVIGYAPRYFMYKQAFDKVFGEFKDTESVEDDANYHESASGSLEAWVAPRTEYIKGTHRTLGTFYVDPAVLDNIFGVNAGDTQYSDQFINNVFFDIKSIRPMSVLGLPQF